MKTVSWAVLVALAAMPTAAWGQSKSSPQIRQTKAVAAWDGYVAGGPSVVVGGPVGYGGYVQYAHGGGCCDPTCYRPRSWTIWDALDGLGNEIWCGVPNPCCQMDPGCCCRGHSHNCGLRHFDLFRIFKRNAWCSTCYHGCGGCGCDSCCGGELLYPSRPLPLPAGVTPRSYKEALPEPPSSAGGSASRRFSSQREGSIRSTRSTRTSAPRRDRSALDSRSNRAT